MSRFGARRGGRSRLPETPVDLRVAIGSVELPSPVMTASGTAGHADELAAYVDLSSLGAVVVKSLSAEPWPGNPAPRVHETPSGMLNSVGLQGPGVNAWLAESLPRLEARRARVVVSIWGRTVEEYRLAAEALAEAPASVVAVEVNLSCPNLDGGRHLFAHDPEVSAEVITATAAVGRPRWAKLSPNTDRLPVVARAVADAGAEAVTLVNTLLGMVIDPVTRRPVLGGGGGGLSGPAVHPVAVRAVYETHTAEPALPIIGVGGVTNVEGAIEFLLAGASAVQVGTASFADPGFVGRLGDDMKDWCRRHGVERVADLTGGAHD